MIRVLGLCATNTIYVVIIILSLMIETLQLTLAKLYSLSWDCHPYLSAISLPGCEFPIFGCSERIGVCHRDCDSVSSIVTRRSLYAKVCTS